MDTNADRPADATVRPYDPGADADDLWELKRAFELELGAGPGDADKRDRYEGKLTDGYRERYLDWSRWCTERNAGCIHVADADDGLAGYVFVLPGQLAMIWDAAVLNEIFVRRERRGTGVADELLAAAVGVARDQDLPLDRLVLDVDRANDRAKGFYERHDFDAWAEMLARELD